MHKLKNLLTGKRHEKHSKHDQTIYGAPEQQTSLVDTGNVPRGPAAHPQPPDIFPQQDQQTEIFNRIKGAVEPVEAQRDIATVNKSSWLNRDDHSASSASTLLSQRSARGFERTVSSGVLMGGSRQSSGQALLDGGRVWTHDRQVLEMAIQAEALADQSDWNPDLQTEEQRLNTRLSKLALEMKVMIGDGNCQFRAISYGLYGSQDYHMSVRQKAVMYMREHKDEYSCFLGEDIETYLDSMQQDYTWGDELTLRAVSDYFGIVINVVTSDQHGWFMRYKPKTVRVLLELFLTYIAPVHYNAIRRKTMTQALKNTLARQNTSAIEQAMRRAEMAEKSLKAVDFSPSVKEALKFGEHLSASTTESQGPPAPLAVARARAIRDAHQQQGQLQPMSPVKEAEPETPSSLNGRHDDSLAAITKDGSLNGYSGMTEPSQAFQPRPESPHSLPKLPSAFETRRHDGSFESTRESGDDPPGSTLIDASPKILTASGIAARS